MILFQKNVYPVKPVIFLKIEQENVVDVVMVIHQIVIHHFAFLVQLELIQIIMSKIALYVEQDITQKKAQHPA